MSLPTRNRTGTTPTTTSVGDPAERVDVGRWRRVGTLGGRASGIKRPFLLVSTSVV